MKRKMRRFNEGGIPDIDREPLRDSSGEIVRSSSGEAVMSGSTPTRAKQYQEDIDLGRRMREQRDAEALDTAMLRSPSKPVAEAKPVMIKPRIEAVGNTDLAEPSTAGFNRAPIKMPAKPRVQTAVKQPPPKAQPKLAETKDAKAEIERLKAYDKPLETSAPEMALLGGPLARGAKALGSSLLSKMAPKASKPRVEPTIPQEPAKALGMSPRKGEIATSGRDLVRRRNTMEQLEAPRKRLPFEKNMGEARLETVANKRRQLTGNRRSDDVIEMGMKKGGKVGSASRRADGIAMRGKTRGKYI